MTPLAAINIGNKALGLDEDAKRDFYALVTGKRSLREMSGVELQAVIDEQRRRGFEPASNARRKGLQGRFAKKLQALWIAGWNLGLIRDRRDAALLAFVKRQSGVDHVRFLHDPADARKAIEALKAWLARDGGVDWTVEKTAADWSQVEGFRIAWAQWRKIIPGATWMGNGREFGITIATILDGPRAQIRGMDQGECRAVIATLTPQDWQVVMNRLGERIRRAKP